MGKIAETARSGRLGMGKVKIFVATHKPIDLKANENVVVGAVGFMKLGSSNFDFDDEGVESISHRNGFFSELSLHYKVWKSGNYPEYVGLMHYRRFISLRDHTVGKDGIHGTSVESFADDFLKEIGLDTLHLNSTLDRGDIFIPEPFDVREVGFQSVYEHYVKSQYHHKEDWDAAEVSIKTKYPLFYKFWIEASRGTLLHAGNIFIMKAAHFEEYSEMLFDILEDATDLERFAGYDSQSKRVLGYLSERVLNAYVAMKRAAGVAVVESKRIFVENPNSSLPQLHLSNDAAVIAVGTSRWYLPHAVAALTSARRSSGKRLNFVFLHGGDLDAESIRRTVSFFESYEETECHFVNLGSSFDNMRVHSFFTPATYYRLVLPQVLHGPDKMVYLDSDTICLEGWDEILEAPMKSELIAGVKDLIMKTFVAKGVPSEISSGGKMAGEYLASINCTPDDYLQAGVLLFNLDEMRKTNWTETALEMATTRNLWFLDQDVINICSSGRKLLLDSEFNSVPLPEGDYAFLDREDALNYRRSRYSPKILHFAGPSKPWDDESLPWANEYFKAISGGPFEIEILRRRTILEMQRFSPTQKRYRAKMRVRSLLANAYFGLPLPVKRILNPIALRVGSALD